ncbi:MAG: tRNA 2-selenouridine(34) synthase MnmH [Candidatus Neomarinimicrobiota bacterium]
MKNKNIYLNNSYPSIDLRSPKEYKKGTIPNSVNLPILNDAEFHEIGKTFRSKGRKAAIDLGYKLISDEKKINRINSWIKFILENNNCFIFCYRGGLRSQIAYEWIKSKGISVNRLEHGYKNYRQQILLMHQNIKNYAGRWMILGGYTGSGKTDIIKNYQYSIDLESIANHKGSAFGKTGIEQPSQSNFENLVTEEYLQKQNSKVLLMEDESRFIGKTKLPGKWYDKMQISDIILLESDLEKRSIRIYNNYVKNPPNSKLNVNELRSFYLSALSKIRKRLGDNHYQTIKNILTVAFDNGDKKLHIKWVKILLEKYYDRMYGYKLNLREKQIIFKGNEADCNHFISDLIIEKK